VKPARRSRRPAASVGRVLDLLLPQRCLGCGAGGTVLCGECSDRLPRLGTTLCERCGAPTAWPVRRCRECAGRRLAFASARAAVAYEGAVRALVAAWKERGLRRLAALAAELVVEAVAPPDVAALCFVPSDGDRSLKRGHHPAERLASELGRRWELPVSPLLRRARTVRRQRGLPLAERRRNVADAFAPAGRAPSRVALVDDVYTSGATSNAAASALRKGGARRVQVVTFARAIR
jgi:predicted amidophosphoribosyltransferase